MTKKITALFLCLVIMFSVVNVGSLKAEAAYDTSKLVKLAEKFPDGKYWNHVGSKSNNPDGYTSTPCTHHTGTSKNCSIAAGACDCNFYNNAIQCAGYAYKIANEIVGTSFSTWEKIYTFDLSALRVGDIIRYLGDSHSITVLGVKGNTIAYTGANWGGNCLIKWSTMDVSDIKNFTYVYHDPNNNSKNSDISFLPTLKNEIWKVSSDSNLNVRSSHSTSSDVVGSIPKSANFNVTEKYDDGTYLWGKIVYGSVKGWAALNYASHVSGSYQMPEISTIKNVKAGYVMTLKWSKVTAADKYTVYFYSADQKTVGISYTEKNSLIYVFEKAGDYCVTVTASNSKASTWKVSSVSEPFTVEAAEKPKIQEIILDSSANLTLGATKTLQASIIPSNANRALTWSSSNKSVATVDQSGKVTAVKSGTATITCKSSDNSAVKASCKITVTPANVTNFKQTASGSSTSIVKLTWSAVKDADGYRIYKLDSSGIWKLAADTASLVYSEKNLSAGTTYKYLIKAYQTVSSKRVLSKDGVTVSAVTTPAKVTGIKVSSITASSYTLSWNKVSGATSYIIYLYNESKKTFEAFKTTTSTSYKPSSKAGEIKKYKVAAVIKGSTLSLTGAKSDEACGFVKPAAVKLKAEAKSKAAVLSWNAVKGATRYEIYIKSGNDYKKIASVSSSSNLTYTKSALKSNQSYSFKVRAVTKHVSTEAFGDFASVTVKVK